MSRPADPGELCRRLEWDSTFFGKSIATARPSAWDAAAFDRALAWCAERSIDCLYLLADAADAPTRRLAEERGFRLVDVRLTFETALDAAPRAAPAPAVRLARAEDVAALRALAAESHRQTRFWADPRFERERCAELYATWVEKSVAGYAERVWVAEFEGRVAGYLTCHLREGGAGEIGLVAVAESARGRGLGGALVERGLAWFAEQRCARVSVVTQGASLGAQRLYQSAGFRSSAVELWYHRWFDRPQ